jgi:hypothetical protein
MRITSSIRPSDLPPLLSAYDQLFLGIEPVDPVHHFENRYAIGRDGFNGTAAWNLAVICVGRMILAVLLPPSIRKKKYKHNAPAFMRPPNRKEVHTITRAVREQSKASRHLLFNAELDAECAAPSEPGRLGYRSVAYSALACFRMGCRDRRLSRGPKTPDTLFATPLLCPPERQIGLVAGRPARRERRFARCYDSQSLS